MKFASRDPRLDKVDDAKIAFEKRLEKSPPTRNEFEERCREIQDFVAKMQKPKKVRQSMPPLVRSPLGLVNRLLQVVSTVFDWISMVAAEASARIAGTANRRSKEVVHRISSLFDPYDIELQRNIEMIETIKPENLVFMNGETREQAVRRTLFEIFDRYANKYYDVQYDKTEWDNENAYPKSQGSLPCACGKHVDDPMLIEAKLSKLSELEAKTDLSPAEMSQLLDLRSELGQR